MGAPLKILRSHAEGPLSAIEPMHARKHKLHLTNESARVCDLVNKSFFLEFILQYVRAVLCLKLGSLDGLLRPVCSLPLLGTRVGVAAARCKLAAATLKTCDKMPICCKTRLEYKSCVLANATRRLQKEPLTLPYSVAFVLYQGLHRQQPPAWKSNPNRVNLQKPVG